MPVAGELYHYPDYVFPGGDKAPKYVLLMGITRSDDLILARTTSQPHGRPKDPPCYSGNPYPGFYISPVGALTVDTWIVLNRLDDHDRQDFEVKIARNKIKLAGSLPKSVFCAVLNCAVSADDTTRMQESTMRDLRAALKCA